MATDIFSVPITADAWIQHVRESRNGKAENSIYWDNVASDVDASQYICTLGGRSTGGDSKVSKLEFTNTDGHKDEYFYIKDVQIWVDDVPRTVNVCLQKVKDKDNKYKICGFAAQSEDTQDVEVNDDNAQQVQHELEQSFRS